MFGCAKVNVAASFVVISLLGFRGILPHLHLLEALNAELGASRLVLVLQILATVSQGIGGVSNLINPFSNRCHGACLLDSCLTCDFRAKHNGIPRIAL